MAAPDATTILLPRVVKTRVTLDLCHEGDLRRIALAVKAPPQLLPLLNMAEVRLASHLLPLLAGQVNDDTTGERA